MDSLQLAYNTFQYTEQSVPPQKDFDIPHLSKVNVMWQKRASVKRQKTMKQMGKGYVAEKIEEFVPEVTYRFQTGWHELHDDLFVDDHVDLDQLLSTNSRGDSAMSGDRGGRSMFSQEGSEKGADGDGHGMRSGFDFDDAGLNIDGGSSGRSGKKRTFSARDPVPSLSHASPAKKSKFTSPSVRTAQKIIDQMCSTWDQEGKRNKFDR